MLAFSRAISGLRVAEQNLYVTSNNLSNVNTEGYHRQRLVQTSFSDGVSNGWKIGMGVDASNVKQIKMEYLETNYRNELPALGQHQMEQNVYNSLQSIIGSDGSAVQDTLSNLWESFNEVSKEYTTSIAGSYLRENAVAFVAELNSIEEQLIKMQTELDGEVKQIVNQINEYAQRIADLNEKITSGESGGVVCCEFRDSRTSIINELAKLIDIEVEDFSDSCVNVRIGNGHLVVGTETNKLDTAQIIPGSTFCYPIWESTGGAIEFESGSLKGVLDMRGSNVAGNSVSSTNGSPKEKMDIVLSIDKDLKLSNIEAMRNTISTLISTMDRQDTNYQFYANNGMKIDGNTLKMYTDYLYGLQMTDIINNYAGDVTSFNDFIDSVNGTCNPEQVIKEYMDYRKLTLKSLKDKFKDNLEIVDSIEKYETSGGNTVFGFQKYLAGIDGMEVNSEAIQDYINNMGVSVNGLKEYITVEMVDLPADKLETVNHLMDANSSRVLDSIGKYESFIKYRADSNKYMLVFTDEKIDPGVDIENTAARLNEIDMKLITVTSEEALLNWTVLAEETDGNVYNINDLKSADGAENMGLALSREANSRLNGTEKTDGIPTFRAELNQLLNGLAKEINGIFRQGANVYGDRHGDVKKDKYGNDIINEETGEPDTYNLDLFVKINDNLPLQMGNIAINPMFSDLNNMPLSLSGETGDFQIGNMLVQLTTTDIFSNRTEYATPDEQYAKFILNFGQTANIASNNVEEQENIINSASEKLLSVSGVSMDEELSNMLKYQYSYTAASKLINVVDEMLETIVNI